MWMMKHQSFWSTTEKFSQKSTSLMVFLWWFFVSRWTLWTLWNWPRSFPPFWPIRLLPLMWLPPAISIANCRSNGETFATISCSRILFSFSTLLCLTYGDLFSISRNLTFGKQLSSTNHFFHFQKVLLLWGDRGEQGCQKHWECNSQHRGHLWVWSSLSGKERFTQKPYHQWRRGKPTRSILVSVFSKYLLAGNLWE